MMTGAGDASSNQQKERPATTCTFFFPSFMAIVIMALVVFVLQYEDMLWSKRSATVYRDAPVAEPNLRGADTIDDESIHNPSDNLFETIFTEDQHENNLKQKKEGSTPKANP